MIKVVILTEGGKKSGFGHISRCVAIYDAFKERNFLPELWVNGDKSVRVMLYGKKYRFINWLSVKENQRSLLENNAIVIIDSYKADLSFYKRLADSNGLVVYLDDFNRLNYPRGIVVNGNISAASIPYCRNGNRYLLGCKFTPLRKEFWDVEKRTIKKPHRVLITFGGDDSHGITPKVLRLVTQNFSGCTKKVIISRGYSNLNQIGRSVNTKTTFIYSPSAQAMKKAMQQSDIAVSGGGVTLYELARMGVPPVVLVLADNQNSNIKGWSEKGFAEYAGSWNDKKYTNKIVSGFKKTIQSNVLARKIKIGQRLIDGQGSRRIVSQCLKSFLADRDILLRDAVKDDLQILFSFANEEGVRKNSFEQARIQLNAHKRWFKEKLEDKNHLFFVAQVNDEIIGQVRFALQVPDAVVSISVCGKFIGLGVGKIILKRAFRTLNLRRPEVNMIRAFITIGNERSAQFFKKMGFKFKRRLFIKKQPAMEFLYGFKKT